MRITKKTILLPIIITFILLIGLAASSSNENESNVPEYAWLAGSWTGDGFGGTSEESWSLPSPDGTMMGMYRHLDAEGKLTFYEFLILDDTGLRLKHFTPDFIGWETKEEFVTFEKVEYSKDKIELKGLTFERKSENEMEIRLKLKKGDIVETEVFKMKRN